MDPTLSIIAIVVLSAIALAVACVITSLITSRPVDALRADNNKLIGRVARLESLFGQEQDHLDDKLDHIEQRRIQDLSAIAERLAEFSTPAGVARLALPAAPRMDLTGDEREDSGTSLFDALVSETHLVPMVRTDLTMSTYTRTEAAQLDELLHAGASR